MVRNTSKTEQKTAAQRDRSWSALTPEQRLAITKYCLEADADIASVVVPEFDAFLYDTTKKFSKTLAYLAEH